MRNDIDLKTQVQNFWNESSCGEVYAAGQAEIDYYESHSKARYALEPYIHDFAAFSEGKDRDVLEIGVGMGADHGEWARSQPRSLVGIDLSKRAVEHTRRRLALYGLQSEVFVGDAERLPFNDASFDIVYSWGVLHHSPNTVEAVNEVFRVLRPNGVARIMIYHTYSLTGYMLWLRYGLLRWHPFRSLKDIYENHLESPGPKAYSIQEAHMLFERFSCVHIKSQLSFGDLLEGAVGQRHKGFLLTLAKKLWPRCVLKIVFKKHGLFLLIEAWK